MRVHRDLHDTPDGVVFHGALVHSVSLSILA